MAKLLGKRSSTALVGLKGKHKHRASESEEVVTDSYLHARGKYATTLEILT